MCTYLTEKVAVTGSGKGADGWFGLTEATVYFDHPVHAPAGHTLNIDFLNPDRGVRPRPGQGDRGGAGLRPARSHLTRLT